MPIISEKDVLYELQNSKSVLLIEPPYRTTYIPLGLAKISTYIKQNGGCVTFSRGLESDRFDLICITSLFTNDIDKVIGILDAIKQSLFLNKIKIIIGGIAASLLSEYILSKHASVFIFTGFSKTLDQVRPDYELNWNAKKEWQTDFSYVFTQRGCINKCGYCAVKKLEPEIWINPNWKIAIDSVRPYTAVSDNNFLISPDVHVEDVIKYLYDNNKQVCFNNGLYSKAINEENAKLLSHLKYCKNGLRMAFDRIEEDGIYQRGCEFLINAGIKLLGKSMTYVLFNFNDTPQEAYYRAREAWKYKSNPYLMQYRPLGVQKKGTHIGKYWTQNLVRAFKNWGELYGFNRGDKTFEGWMKKYKTKLTKEDWDKWYFKR